MYTIISYETINRWEMVWVIRKIYVSFRLWRKDKYRPENFSKKDACFSCLVSYLLFLLCEHNPYFLILCLFLYNPKVVPTSFTSHTHKLNFSPTTTYYLFLGETRGSHPRFFFLELFCYTLMFVSPL